MKRLLDSQSWSQHLPAKILSLLAAILLFLFYRIEAMGQRTFTVPVELHTNQELVPSELTYRRVRVTIRGSEEDLSAVLEEDIRVEADFSAFDLAGVYRVPLRISTRGILEDRERFEIMIDPIDLRLGLEQRVVRSLPLQAVLVGDPAPDHELMSWSLVPEVVEITGPASRVESLTVLETEAIDLGGRREDFNLRVRLQNRDPLVELPGGAVVEFQAEIREQRFVETREGVRPVLRGLSDGMRQEGDIPAFLLRLEGPRRLLEQFSAGPGNFFVDAEGLESPGRYRLVPRLVLPQGLLLLDLDPANMELVLRRAGEVEP